MSYIKKMHIEKSCKNCNKSFIRKHGGEKFCCKECRDSYTVINFSQEKYIQYMKSALKRDLEFNLSLEEFLNLWQEPCEYCGSEIKSIGVDRVDSRKGYNIDNIVPCCSTCNLMKTTFGKYYFIAHCKKIAKLNKNIKIVPKTWQD